ncbi:glycerol-3-phosphate dehydrogenase (NAD(P)+) [Lutimaribacter pacificus]|uniref:Glycerol-3-phosphate dehydrogenase [NAD(P)+] n=1 Tax=Lutimaribacter pacificus TaxID=391948 RepID=A0A1H0MAM7_9RHOB|nr:NAD(P)H-dependent glycerol-3-phosphate dehydrogenase [Lutimaribacter pacificus]SDO77558.1 glycerol-3-phosphate dehydrogenase (NAD(P)+) [Lutimaribacter pacificus]SHK99517.1 glycerol-3-phosphate dehydrogenase (NAD(P)+) [Lutimaribacter pacificus]
MICVAGAGAFGTALAISLAANGPVTLWARDPAHADEMRKTRENARRLPGITLPDAIGIATDFDTVSPGLPVLLAVPMQQLRGMAETHAAALQDHPLVACCKGIELKTGQGPTAILSSVLPGAHSAILTGPSFAADIARGLPTALTLACADPDMGETLQEALSTPALRLYRTTDTVGAELGGALKNVIAIAAGAVMGAGLGDSARAALMTRGYAEMTRLAVAMGARPETLAGLSGFGDLVLTCTGAQSRNYRFGHALGAGADFDPTITVEGAATARAALSRAHEAGVDLPITAAVVALLDGSVSVLQVMDRLLSRPLKEE